MAEYYPSKTSYNSRWGGNEVASCLACDHRQSGSCACEGCQEVNRIAAQQKAEQEAVAKQEFQQQLERRLIETKLPAVSYESLSFSQKVYLGAITRGGIDEGFNFIRPLDQFITLLAPTYSYQGVILNSLTKTVPALVISPHSPTEVFNKTEQGFSYHPTQVSWELNVSIGTLVKVPLVEAIMNPVSLDTTPEQKLQLWREIALQEVLEDFLESISSLLNVDFSVGEMTITVFNNLLLDYSTAQIYGIIHKAINEALRFKAEKQTSNKHAANYVISNAQSYGERAKAKGWELNSFSRKRNRPISVISRFYFEKVLGIADKGFYEKPNLDLCQ